ncbi:alpha/beta hydrolase [Chitinophaga sedimenti]|uniref:alpha/beta fold hydrolase n=1 Tax=Chitinophaga sedimenti TaxID=2033606 RepID=UPI002004C222|nr:alpha/beta hydrolase [Chitinophaga sedimenti]MCK7556693.1 alpha/beta hydrolase [Chitinophaga sedimenti]
MSKHIYLISGLGADDRVFGNLEFPAGYETHYLPRIKPAGPDESIEAYAARMAQSIQHPNPILLGLSFGGMMCVEIARFLETEKVILLSSIKHRKERPPYYRYNLLSKFVLTKVPDRLLFGRRRLIVEYFLQTETKYELQLVREYLAKKDYAYTRWAMSAICQWKNDWMPERVVHIHGTKDRPFPIRYLQPTHRINGGGHFMVLNRAEEINRIIKESLEINGQPLFSTSL